MHASRAQPARQRASLPRFDRSTTADTLSNSNEFCAEQLVKADGSENDVTFLQAAVIYQMTKAIRSALAGVVASS
jgi:hypothetical protein